MGTATQLHPLLIRLNLLLMTLCQGDPLEEPLLKPVIESSDASWMTNIGVEQFSVQQGEDVLDFELLFIIYLSDTQILLYHKSHDS